MNTHQPAAKPSATPHSPLRTPHSLGFTLVEMIVVTAIIALLAALIFPAVAAARRAGYLRRARTELMAVDHAIQGYKDKLGHYPPDSAVPGTDGLPHYEHNQLFYELRGTSLLPNGNFQALDGSVTISPTDVSIAFGTGGFVNCTRGGGDEGRPAQQFLPELRAGQYADTQVVTKNGSATCRLLGCSFDGPNAVVDPTTTRKFSPWCYNSSSPTNNANGFDLWVDIQIGSKAYRISNWSSTPQLVP